MPGAVIGTAAGIEGWTRLRRARLAARLYWGEDLRSRIVTPGDLRRPSDP